MVEKRPIIYYQNLMPHYDRELAALMQAKVDYILLSRDGEVGPKAEIKQANSRLTQPAASQQQPELVAPVVVSVLWPQKELQANGSAVAKKKRSHQRPQIDKATSISGLGLSLDQIFGEEEAVANRDASQYFKD